ncbi:barstar family protein [Paenibacillus wulumuqiensis]|uniref:barstar family protein n=1 Tax=Paenibacillus wulumuqiensis TaxID=1567107 RepID=UPI0006192157|nr:barstar family protein [Paenibacillus wulumuqiensis]
MKTVWLNGEEFSTIQELHEQLKEKLELPEFYGGNLDALWDCLTGMIELPLELHWTNYGVSQERLGDQAERVRSLLEEAEEEGIGFRVVVQD